MAKHWTAAPKAKEAVKDEKTGASPMHFAAVGKDEKPPARKKGKKSVLHDHPRSMEE